MRNIKRRFKCLLQVQQFGSKLGNWVRRRVTTRRKTSQTSPVDKEEEMEEEKEKEEEKEEEEKIVEIDNEVKEKEDITIVNRLKPSANKFID